MRWLIFFFRYIVSVIAVISFALYYVIFLRKTKKWEKSNIPFLPPTFLIGHKYFLNMHKDSLTTVLHRIYRDNQKGDLVGFFMTMLPAILVRDPDLIQKIFVKNSKKTFRNFFILPKDDIDTQSMPNFASDKAQWKTGRSVMVPAFSPMRMGGQKFEIFKKQIERLWCYLEKARLGGQPIRTMHFIENFVNDSMFHWNFGEESNSYEETCELQSVYQEYFEKPTSEMLVIFAQMCWPSVLNYGVKVFKSLKIVQQKYVDFMRGFLVKRMEYRMKNDVRVDDFIDHLMSLKHGESNRLDGNENIISKDKPEISIRQMTSYALTLLFAGLDSASQSSISAVHLLSLYPEYQDRIKREIDDVMEKHNVSEFTFEVIQDLQFTKQCIDESLRLIPLYKFIMRRSSEDFRIPGTNYHFRAGDIFMAVPYSLHRDPKYFKDPDKFYPERFNPENIDSLVSDAYIPAGLGLRKCPGFRIGVLQTVMFVASLLYKYEIRPRSHLQQMTDADLDPKLVTNMPRKELLIELIPR